MACLLTLRQVVVTDLVCDVRYAYLFDLNDGGECEYDAVADSRVVATNSEAQMMSSEDVIDFFEWEVDEDQVW